MTVMTGIRSVRTSLSTGNDPRADITGATLGAADRLQRPAPGRPAAIPAGTEPGQHLDHVPHQVVVHPTVLTVVKHHQAPALPRKR